MSIFLGFHFSLNNIVLFCPNKTTIRRKTKNHTPVKRKPETQSGFIMRINCTRSLGFRIPFYWSQWSLYWDKKGQYYWDKIGNLKHSLVERNLIGSLIFLTFSRIQKMWANSCWCPSAAINLGAPEVMAY